MADIVMYISAFIAVLVTAYYGVHFLFPDKEDEVADNTSFYKTVEGLTDKQRTVLIDLAEASLHWTGKGSLELGLGRTSGAWTAEEKAPEKIVRPLYANPLINEFYDDVIDPQSKLSSIEKTIINKILSILDKDGDCPSVVKNTAVTDPNNAYDKKTFSYLARIPLTAHTLKVARAVVRAKSVKPVVAGEAIIVALSHDLGKIPAWHINSYHTGDHAQTSVIVLENLVPEFKDHPAFVNLRNVIKEYHLPTTKVGLTSTLKECDAVVRNAEISLMVADLVFNKIGVPGDKNPDNPDSTSYEAAGEVSPNAPALSVPDYLPREPSFALSEPLGNEHLPQPKPNLSIQAPAVATKPSGKRLPTPWLNAQALLDELKPLINESSGQKWDLVSQPDGLVYANVDSVWDALKKTVPDEYKPDFINADSTSRKNYLYSAIWEIGETLRVVPLSLLNPSSFTVLVEWTSGTGKPVVRADGKPFFFIVFTAEAFGALASDLEESKSVPMRRLVKKITPLPPF